MSEFPEIQPFGPRPAPHNEEPSSEANAVPTAEPAAKPATDAQQIHVNLTVAVVAAMGVGFALGYLAFRYQQLILRQSRLDEFLNYAQAWIREQGPKITEPIRQGIESTGSSVESAFKKVGHPLDSLNPFHKKRHGLIINGLRFWGDR
jgi:hypothetical protein